MSCFEENLFCFDAELSKFSLITANSDPNEVRSTVNSFNVLLIFFKDIFRSQIFRKVEQCQQQIDDNHQA